MSPCLVESTRSLQLETRQNFLGVRNGMDFNLRLRVGRVYCCRYMHMLVVVLQYLCCVKQGVCRRRRPFSSICMVLYKNLRTI